MRFNDRSCSIIIDCEEISAIISDWNDKDINVLWKHAIQCENLLSEDDNFHMFRNVISELFQAIPDTIDYTAIPVKIALPDPLTIQSLFHFDDLPEGKDDIDQLIRWQFDKEFQLDPLSQCVTFQRLPIDDVDQIYSLFCLTIPKNLVDMLQEHLKEIGCIPILMDASSCYYYQYLDVLMHEERSMLVCLRPSYYSLSIIGGGEYLLHHTSHYYNNIVCHDSSESVLKSIQQLIKRYNAAHTLPINTLHVTDDTRIYEYLHNHYKNTKLLTTGDDDIAANQPLTLLEKAMILRS